MTLADARPYALVLATKRQDPLVSDLAAHGYRITGNLDDLAWAAMNRRDGSVRMEPVNPKVVYWPQAPPKTPSRQRTELLARKFAHALDWADETGRWLVLIDETMYLAENMRLERELNHLWFQGRTQRVSVVACAQRPSRVPRLAFSSATYLFVAQTNDSGDLERLRDIAAGFPKGMIEEAVTRLDWHAHEFLFIDTRAKGLARVIAPPR